MDTPNEFVMRLSEDERNQVLQRRAHEAIHGRTETAIERGNVANTVAEHTPKDESPILARLSVENHRLRAEFEELNTRMTERLNKANSRIERLFEENREQRKSIIDLQARFGVNIQALQESMAGVASILKPYMDEQ